MSLSLCDQRTYQKQKNFILLGNLNYHFDEKVIQKDINYIENSGKVLKHSVEDGENSWKKVCYLRKDLAENVDTVGTIRKKNYQQRVISFRK